MLKMIIMDIWNRSKHPTENFAHLPSFLLLILALPGSIICTLMIEGSFGHIGYYAFLGAGGILVLSVLVLLRQDELAVSSIFIVSLCIDWYQGYSIVAIIVACLLLLVFFFARSAERPWIAPRPLWLWVLFLTLPIPAVIQGAHSFYDFAFYYPNIFFGALVMFWLGTLIARDWRHLRNVFRCLALFGTILAIITIIQEITGIVVLGTPHMTAYLSQVSGFELANSYGVNRIGSYFYNPDWNGAFFATVIFIPYSLLHEASSFLWKLIYASEIFLILIALLFTYSIGSCIAAVGGILTFALFMRPSHYRVLLPVQLVIVGVIATVAFPTQINLLMQHMSDPHEAGLRFGAWQTAINVIKAFPITGIGLGFTNYEQLVEPYRVPAQYTILAHPHNSYLELGVMAGCPVLILFLALLVFALWQAYRHWRQAARGSCHLFCGGIASVIALSINSLSVNAWTLPPLSALGWLLLGVISSPLLRQEADKHNKENGERKVEK